MLDNKKEGLGEGKCPKCGGSDTIGVGSTIHCGKCGWMSKPRRSFSSALEFQDIPIDHYPEIHIHVSDVNGDMWTQLVYKCIGSSGRSISIDEKGKAFKMLMEYKWIFKGIEYVNQTKEDRTMGRTPQKIITLKADLLAPQDLVPIIEELEKD